MLRGNMKCGLGTVCLGCSPGQDQAHRTVVAPSEPGEEGTTKKKKRAVVFVTFTAPSKGELLLDILVVET